MAREGARAESKAGALARYCLSLQSHSYLNSSPMPLFPLSEPQDIDMLTEV